MAPKEFIRLSILFATLTFAGAADYKSRRASLVDYVQESSRPDVLPRSDGKPLAVQVGVTLDALRDLDFDKNEIEMNGMVSYSWNSNITWSDDQHDFDSISTPADVVWKPDMTVFNLIEPMVNTAPDVVSLSRDGQAMWVQKSNIRVSCDMIDVDKHNVSCLFTFGSWTHSGFDITLHVMGGSLDLSNYVRNPTYKVLGGTLTKHVQHYPCCPEPYETIRLQLTLSRRMSASKFLNWF